MDITHIINHLGSEATAYKEFIAVLQEETECLVSRNYKGLYETAGNKQALLSRIKKLNETRAALLARSARGLDASADGTAAAVSAIIDSAPPHQKEEFLRLHDSLGSLIDTIHEVNKVNSLVIKGSLEHINKTLGFFSNFMPGTVYKPTGAFGDISLKGSRLNKGA
jgi:flagellar biosynthesis/type III secretory pathway chaperone